MKIHNIEAFKECTSCARKPGSPVLCEGCLTNRRAIEQRDHIIEEVTRKLEIVDILINKI